MAEKKDTEIFPATLKAKADLTEAATIGTKSAFKAMHRLLDAMIGKREMNVMRHRMLTAAQTEKDAQAIEMGTAEFRDGLIKEISPQIQVDNPMLKLEMEQETENLKENILVAFDNLKDTPDSEVSDEELDPDFIARWRREAKVIGDETLQSIWGKILAEEVKKPKSISYRTLDTIRNISREEAEFFCEYGRFICNNEFLVWANLGPRDEKKFAKIFNVVMLQRFLDSGLITSSGDGLTFTPERIVTYNGIKYQAAIFGSTILINQNSNTEWRLSGNILTVAGRELCRIADLMSIDEKIYFKAIRRCSMREGGEGELFLTLHKIDEEKFFDIADPLFE